MDEPFDELLTPTPLRSTRPPPEAKAGRGQGVGKQGENK